MTRDEHLAWAKERALKYLPNEPRNAFTSMLSDLCKHPELEKHPGTEIGAMFMLLPGWIDNVHEVRRWIVGFN